VDESDRLRASNCRERGGRHGESGCTEKTADTNVLSLKVTLRHIRPPIWRRILVPRDMTLADLHRAIQAVMGWEDAHLHVFDVGGRRYSAPAMLPDAANEARVTLNSLAKSDMRRFTYTYDFGDDWEHDILIEKILPATTARAFPACVAGKRNCPPEDCGGPWGYEEMLAALADPNHPEHADIPSMRNDSSGSARTLTRRSLRSPTRTLCSAPLSGVQSRRRIRADALRSISAQGGHAPACLVASNFIGLKSRRDFQSGRYCSTAGTPASLPRRPTRTVPASSPAACPSACSG